jgi:hypothetical protein
LRGAYIDEELDLRGTTVGIPLSIVDCCFAKILRLEGAALSDLTLDGSLVPGIGGFGVKAGSIFLRHGFHAIGKVSLMHLRCQGRLDFENARFENPGSMALSLSGARIAGDVFLNNGFLAVGQVSLINAEIGGHLYCMNATLDGGDGDALTCDTAVIRGSLFFRDMVKVKGAVSLTGARVDAICDDAESWQPPLTLDGFCYGRIDSGPTDSDTRIRWLGLQRPERHGDKFWPQPWEHLAKILRETGHVEDAKRVAIAKQKMLRAAGLIGQRPVEGERLWRRLTNRFLNAVHRTFHDIYGILAGFGYQPLKTVGWMILVWFGSALAYQAAAADGLIGPTNSGIYANARFERCGDGGQPGREHWTRCVALPPEYSPFDPFVFSLDVILPLLDLKQETEWRPIVHSAGGRELIFGHPLRFLMWFEIFFGWVTSLLLVSVLGRLVQKD